MKRGLRIAAGIAVLLAMISYLGFMRGDGASAAGGGSQTVPAQPPAAVPAPGREAPKKQITKDLFSAKTAGQDYEISANKTLSSATYSKNVVVNPYYTATVGKNAKITIDGDLVVGGSFVMSSGTLTVNGDILVFGSFAASGTAKVVVNKVPSSQTSTSSDHGGSFVTSNYYGLNASLHVSGGADITVSYAQDGGFFVQDDALFRMDSASAKITVYNRCYFGGQATYSYHSLLTAGTLEIINGGFYQSSDYSDNAFFPSDAFNVIMRSTTSDLRYVFFESPDGSFFRRFSSAGVQFYDDSLISLSLPALSSDLNLNFNNAMVALNSDLNHKKLTITAQAVYPLDIGEFGAMLVNGGTLTVNGNLVLGGGSICGICMNTANDKVAVNGRVDVFGQNNTLLAAGELAVNGDFYQHSTIYPDSFTPRPGFAVRITGANRIVHFDTPEASYFTKFLLDSGATLNASSNVSVNCDLTANAVWNYPHLYYRGNLNGRSLTVAGRVTIPEGSAVTVNGGTLLARGDLTVSGSLVMNGYSDLVIVGGNFLANGSVPSTLTGGRLSIQGGFAQSGTAGNFVATGGHTTVFTGNSTAQAIDFASSGAKFAHLAILNKNTTPPGSSRYDDLVISGTGLSGIDAGAGTLVPPFGGNHSEYMVLLPKGTDGTTVTLQPDYPSDTVLTYSIDGGTEQTVSGGIAVSGVPHDGKKTLAVTVSAVNSVYDGRIVGGAHHLSLQSEPYRFTVETVNPDLGSLALPAGAVADKPFDPDTLAYNVQLPETAASFAWAPQPDNPDSGVAVSGGTGAPGATATVALAPGESRTYTVTVTAQDGTTTKAYTVTFKRRNPVESISVSPGTLTPAFNKGAANYEVYIPASTASVTVTAARGADCSDLRINGAARPGDSLALSPAPGAAAVATITAKDSDGITTTAYTITVRRVAMLSGIGLSAGSLSPAFAPERSAYEVYLGGGASSVRLTPAASSGCSFTIDGTAVASKTYSVPNGGKATATVACAGPGGVAQTYTVDIYSIAPITGISVQNGTLSPAFSAGRQSYAVSIPAATESVTLTPAVAASYRAAAGDAVAPVTLTPAVGESLTATFRATAVNGAVFTYSVTVSRAAMVTGIKVSPGMLSPAFKAATTAYTVDVAATVSKVKVTPAKAKSGVQYITINGKKAAYAYLTPVIGGSASAEIRAYGTDGKLKVTYTVTVRRAKLVENIAVSAGTLVFNPAAAAYDVYVPADTGTVDVTATQASSGVRSMTNSGPVLRPEAGGTAKAVITAVATDKKTKSVYTVTVHRAPIIARIAVTGGALSPAFTTAVKNYTVNLPATADNDVTITATPDAVCTRMTIDGEEATSKTVHPAIGEEIGVTVTGRTAAGTSVTYTVTVNRAAMVTGIKVSPGALNPAFRATTTTYTVDVAATVPKVKVTPAKAKSGVQYITINGKKAAYAYLTPAIGGSASAEIRAYGTDGKLKVTYTVTVRRAKLVENIAVSAGTLVFNPATAAYDVYVPADTATVNVTATQAATGVRSMTNSGPVLRPEAGGAAKAVITAVATDKKTKSVYTVTVHRAPIIARIAVTGGALSPAFTTAVKNYMVSLPATADNDVTITATPDAVCTQMTIDGAAVASKTIHPVIGETIRITIIGRTAAGTEVAYTVTVSRAALVKSISCATGGCGLTPAFSATTADYTITLPASKGSAVIRVAKMPAGVKSLTINGKAATSYTAKPPAGGSVTVTITATASDGRTQSIYTVTVTRAAP